MSDLDRQSPGGRPRRRRPPLRRTDRRGATVVEYAVMLALVLLAMLAALLTFGNAVQQSYNGSSGSITSYVGAANSGGL